MMKKIFTIISLLLSINFLCAQEQIKIETPQLPEKNAIKAEESMTCLDGFVLGLVEGITEFLPISSTGHLILTNNFLGLEKDNAILNSKGEIITSRKGETYTLKNAVDAYAIVIQIAAIAAVALLYWAEILSMLKGLCGKSKEGLLLTRNLIVAFLPAAVIGFLLHKTIEKVLFGAIPVIIALVLGAFAMFWAQKKFGKKFEDKNTKTLELHELSVKQSLTVGFLQCVALWPGTSRSMMTIIGSYIVGLKPVQAAKFSFLLGLVTLSAASLYKLLKDGKEMTQALSTVPLLIGLIVAFISSAIAAKWLVGFLNRRGLAPFAWYRILVAILIACYFFICK